MQDGPGVRSPLCGFSWRPSIKKQSVHLGLYWYKQISGNIFPNSSGNLLTASTATTTSVLCLKRQTSTKAPSERPAWHQNHISRILPQTDDFIYKSHGVHFTLTCAEPVTGPVWSFPEFRAMAYVTCHLVADKAWSNTPMLWLDWAEQLISRVWIPKQIHSGYFETGLRKLNWQQINLQMCFCWNLTWRTLH